MGTKEIWYVWDKKTTVQGIRGIIQCGKRLNLKGGAVLESRNSNTKKTVSCYTLDETRERVECDDCGGYGLVYGGEIFMMVDGESIPNYITEQDCPCCKGRGYILKTEAMNMLHEVNNNG